MFSSLDDLANGRTTELEQSTAMFGRLADPSGANNALSQVLYGLALRLVQDQTFSCANALERHGWGIPADPSRAITFLAQAASNSAAVESLALAAGRIHGGTAKGELVLAIYELANCFRHGWGVVKDPVAARNYYETAANLGDTDAMNEAARCYEEGFGGKKDKVGGWWRIRASKCWIVSCRASTDSTSLRRRDTIAWRRRMATRHWGIHGPYWRPLIDQRSGVVSSRMLHRLMRPQDLEGKVQSISRVV